MSRIDKLWSDFLPRWIIANVFGWFIFSFIQALKFNFIGFSMGVGIFIGFLQWLVLKKHMGVDTMWIWVSAITYGIYIISISGLIPGGLLTRTLVGNIVVLGLLGFLQRSVLDYNMVDSIRWVGSSIIAGTFALIILYFFLYFLSSVFIPIVWGIYGGVYGTITGLTLVGLYSKTIYKPLA